MNQPPKVKVFVEGRYRKLTRDLPQTVFFCPACKGHPRRRKNCEKCDGFGKLSRDSVQELIGWVLGKAFGTRKHKFHGSGREDVDVRMLGSGRPFIMELIGPKVTRPDLAALEEEVNRRNEGRLEIEGLHWTEKTRVRVLKESKHAKRYRALVSVSEVPDPAEVEALVGRRVTLDQETPQRVAHRRADLVRKRWIEYESIEPGPDAAPEDSAVEGDAAEDAAPRAMLAVTAVTAHGTYFKEAISGEDGRSRPSLGSLLGGVECKCEALDVLAILDEEGGDEESPPEQGSSMSFGAGL